MIERLIPLEIPPGLLRNGTMYQRRGRWADGNGVRFLEDGSPVALAGQDELVTTGSLPARSPNSAFAFNDGTRPVFLFGTADEIMRVEFAFNYPTSGHALVSQTPAVPLAADADWWNFEHMGDACVGVTSFGAVYEIPDSGAVATEVTPDASYMYAAAVATPENFLVLTRSKGGTVGVQWASQGTNDTWSPTSTNSAGSLDAQTSVPFIAARRVGGTTLLWSVQSVFRLDYVGAPLYYGLRPVSAQCGVIGPHAVAVVGDEAIWMGPHGFYRWNGYVQPLPCDIAEDIFPNLATGKNHTVFARVMGERDEIWWHWTAAGSTTPDQVAIYNWRLGVWSKASLSLAAGVGTGVWLEGGATGYDPTLRTVPIGITALAELMQDESDGVLAGAYIESGPILLDPAGNDLVRVQKWIADNAHDSDDEALTLYKGTWPKVGETSAVYSIPSNGGEIDVRDTARYIRFRQALGYTDSRVGTPRVGVVKDAKR